MAVQWYVDQGLAKLIAQWKAKFPDAVVYTIGDASHASRDSEHNPEPQGTEPGADYGEVDAADFMKGNGVTAADLQELRDQLVAHRDARLWYVIWNHKITSSVTEPWVERPYTGSDPHTGHVHVSVNDKFDNNPASWKLEDEMYGTIPLDGKVTSAVKYGDDDAAHGGFDAVRRVQALLKLLQDSKVEIDGVYGPQTRNALKGLMVRVGDKDNTGKVVGIAEVSALYGIWAAPKA